MNRRNAIREKCLYCSGDSPKEVLLCHIFDCYIWPFRTGGFVASSAYQKRIEKAFKNYKADVAALAEMGITKEDFLRLPKRMPSAKSEAPDAA
jgi:hypothetical protein